MTGPNVMKGYVAPRFISGGGTMPLTASVCVSVCVCARALQLSQPCGRDEGGAVQVERPNRVPDRRHGNVGDGLPHAAPCLHVLMLVSVQAE